MRKEKMYVDLGIFEKPLEAAFTLSGFIVGVFSGGIIAIYSHWVLGIITFIILFTVLSMLGIYLEKRNLGRFRNE